MQEISALQIAEQDTIRNFKGGAAELGPIIGRTAAVLANKVNPKFPRTNLTVIESVTLQAHTQDYRMLRATAHALGHVALKAPANVGDTSDMDILAGWAAWQRDIAETIAAMTDALSGGRIDRNNIELIRKELNDDLTKGLELCMRFDALVDEAPDDIADDIADESDHACKPD